MYINSFKLSFLLLLFALLGTTLSASHFSAGEVYYRYAPTATDTARYQVYVNWFRNNSGATITGNTQVICLHSSCFPDANYNLTRLMPPPGMASPNDQNGGWIVTGIDDCADPSDPSYKDLSVHKFSGFITLPGRCLDFTISVNAVCCRDASTNMAASPNMYMEAHLNNMLGPSSSPEIISSPGVGFCVQSPNAPSVNFAVKAIDAENDSIIYSLAQPESGVTCGPGTAVPYDSGYTALQPIPSWNGLTINQSTGVFTLSPKQQGSFLVKIVIDNYRFDTLSLSWIYVGNSVREVIIPVTANCNFSANQSVSMGLLPSSVSYTGLLNSSMDSLKQAYQLNSIYKDSLVTTVAELNQKQCFEKFINLQFDNPLRSNSITPTDFRLIGPDSIVKPIVAIHDTSSGLYTNSISLELLNPLVLNGNYVLQIRNGNDGNTLIGKCGNTFAEFSVILVPVSGCPVPEYALEQINVVADSNIQVQWKANAALADSALKQHFGAWDLYVSENQGPWVLENSSTQASDSLYKLSFGGALYQVDHNNYDFFVELRYAGENWGPSNYAGQMLLEQVSVQADSLEDFIQLSWNDYEIIPANRRSYLVDYGHFYSVDSVIWQTPTQTNTNSINLRVFKTPGIGQYAIRVRAVDGQNEYPFAQSNWIIYNPSTTPIGLDEFSQQWIIPNILNPNGNGQNESFIISKGEGPELPDFSLKVYSPSGQLVFEDSQYQNSASSAWSGRQSNGQLLPQGIYLYLIEFKGNTGEKQQISGRLSLVY